MENIVALKKERPVVSTYDLFKMMGYNEHRKLKEVINNHIAEFKSFGILPVERVKPSKKSGGGRPFESYLLDEDQFILLVVLAKNTPEAVALKVRVCKEFALTRKRLANRLEAKTGFLPMTKAIQSDHEEPKGYHYSNEVDLINRIVFGMSAKQFKEKYEVDNVRDNATKQQLELVAKMQEINTALINLSMNFQERKGHLTVYSTAKLEHLNG